MFARLHAQPQLRARFVATRSLLRPPPVRFCSAFANSYSCNAASNLKKIVPLPLARADIVTAVPGLLVALLLPLTPRAVATLQAVQALPRLCDIAHARSGHGPQHCSDGRQRTCVRGPLFLAHRRGPLRLPPVALAGPLRNIYQQASASCLSYSLALPVGLWLFQRSLSLSLPTYLPPSLSPSLVSLRYCLFLLLCLRFSLHLDMPRPLSSTHPNGTPAMFAHVSALLVNSFVPPLCFEPLWASLCLSNFPYPNSLFSSIGAALSNPTPPPHPNPPPISPTNAFPTENRGCPCS